MARYLTDLADVLRAAGLTVIEVDGWKTRARSSGGFADGRPTCLMIHHTASPTRTDGQRDVDYIVSGSPVRPVANIYTQRNGVVWVCAAGATNTNGQGRDSWGGGVPDDAMNLYAISNEIANDGVGESYPPVQQASVLKSSAAICARYGIGTHRVRGHFEWAPSRKVDPRGPSMWAPTGGIWNMDAFRHDVGLALQPPQPSTPQENDMVRIDFNPNTPQWVSMVIGATTITHTVNGHHAAVLARAHVAQEPVDKTELLGILLSLRATNDSPFAPGWASADAELHAAWESAKMKAV